MLIIALPGIKLSHECHCKPSPLGSSAFLNMGAVLGPLNQGCLLVNLQRNSMGYILKKFYLYSYQHHMASSVHV